VAEAIRAAPAGPAGAPSVPWRIHAVLPRSRANGPGLRYVIWSQGCTLGCAGCFNPQTHSPGGPGLVRQAGEMADAVLAEPGIEGVTLSGGEPLEQPAAVAAFCRRVRARSGLSIVVLTGFTRAEIERAPGRMAAVGDADMVIAGRYNARRHLGSGLRGSANKVYWARTSRYRAGDFAAGPDVELIVAPDGSVTVTGLPEGEIT
jgi:anaerobic ribonucleoside-triphosphate reductase activating protein